MPKQLATIVEVRQETSSVKIFFFKISTPLSFLCGQFVMLTIPGYVDKAGKGPRRAYSIASAPQDELLELVIKINPAPSLSSELDLLKKGDVVEIDGPYGKFVFDTKEQNLLFVAGGTGIAPLVSMIRFCQSQKKNMCLLFGVKTERDIMYRKELDLLQKKEVLKVVYCLSQEVREGFVAGRVTKILQQEAQNKNDVYVCGSPGFVKDVVFVLDSVGIAKEHIHKEQW